MLLCRHSPYVYTTGLISTPSDHPKEMKGNTHRSKSSLLTFSPSRRINKSQSELGVASSRACEPNSINRAFLGRISAPSRFIKPSISSCRVDMIFYFSVCKYSHFSENPINSRKSHSPVCRPIKSCPAPASKQDVGHIKCEVG